MKFPLASTLLGLFSLTLSLPSVQACEHDCQVGVSHAFADKYQLLSSHYFSLLSQNIDDSLFYGVPHLEILTPVESGEAIHIMRDSITKAQNAWDVTLFQTIFETIFQDEPKFKGDCNNPHRVTQPHLGVNWTMPDCHNMDYICGNPPSICHFMPMIKDRIVKKLIYQLQERMDGNDSDIYANFIGPALQTLLQQYTKLVPYTAAIHGNLNHILEVVRGKLVEFADADQWRREWDMDIKILLLTFP
ncbi:hypothetical protein BGZ46_000711 [Entomortierella lignicola]|nr:hypothetical protein BGZ46_000711 [Entomortierella lignicola]